MLNETEKLNIRMLWIEFWLIIIIAAYTFQDGKIIKRVNHESGRLDTTIVRCNSHFESYSEIDSAFLEFSDLATERILRTDSFMTKFVHAVQFRFEKNNKETIYLIKEIEKLQRRVDSLENKKTE